MGIVTVSKVDRKRATALLEVESLAFAHEGSSKRMVDIAPVPAVLYAARDHNRIVGGLIAFQMRDDPAPRWNILSLFTHPKHRKRGIATLLLDRFMRDSRGAVDALAPTGVHRIYERCGFGVTSYGMEIHRE